LQDSEVRAHFAKINLQAAGGSPAEAAAFIKKENTVWGDVIKEAHIPTH
jgi:tripartite-type tricarboxylate transporter receptor subunit TctC